MPNSSGTSKLFQIKSYTLIAQYIVYFPFDEIKTAGMFWIAVFTQCPFFVLALPDFSGNLQNIRLTTEQAILFILYIWPFIAE